MADDAIRCDACPVLCYIKPGRTGSCDRYANADGQLVRVDPHIVLERTLSRGDSVVPFLQKTREWDGALVSGEETFVTAIGAGTTYPDYKPAPFIISSQVEGVDMVTVVTEGIFSYCGVKLKIDTDRYLGAECSIVRAQGEAVGHVTTNEYGSQMLSLGGVRHLTGGSRSEGTVTCDTLLSLCNGKAVELEIENGAKVVVQAGKPPIVGGVLEERMRVGCGSATIGMFAKQWFGKVDEVVVVDDHITGVLSEHQAGKLLGVPETGITMKGRRSTPGRYFRVAEPGTSWGGTNISDPLAILAPFDPEVAWPGLRLLMVSTTGEHWAYFELDEALRPVEKELSAALRESVTRIRENCEPALCTVLFMGGAGGSLRAGVTENPVKLTHSVGAALTRVTCGGAPVYVWPGGGITFMVDVSRMPENAFGYVPTPALVAPIEFTLKLADYAALGGYMDHVRPLASIQHDDEGRKHVAARFVTVLDELCGELTFLRQATREDGPLPDGPVARRMVEAVLPYAAKNFITPMAAVAGAVAEEILHVMTAAAALRRAYVNDGGDIALHLMAGETFVVGMVASPEPPMNPMFRKARNVGHSLFGTTTIDCAQPIRGIATSGWRGRSFSLGIADAVTVLADKAAVADAAATMIANAVNLPAHPAIGRARACDLAPDSDLGERLVTQSVGKLSTHEINESLAAGVQRAESLREDGLIRAAALSLQGEIRVCSSEAGLGLVGIAKPDRSLVHA